MQGGGGGALHGATPYLPSTPLTMGEECCEFSATVPMLTLRPCSRTNSTTAHAKGRWSEAYGGV